MEQASTGSGLINRYILLNDIVASSRLMEEYPLEFNTLLDRHNQLFLTTCGDFGGEIFKNTGDGYYVFFETFNECAAYAHELAKQFAQFPTIGDDEHFRVGIAIHAGEIRPSVTQYFGPALNRASRLCAICHPGQILISGDAVPDEVKLPEDLTLTDLGLHHLRDLGQPEQLYQLVSPGLPQTEFPPLETLNNRPHNLWRQPNEFIGRERELRELQDMLLSAKQLVSIIGLGGYGKSRLSAHLLADLLPHFDHGVFIIELAPINDASGIASATARALGFSFFGKVPPEEQLINYLRKKEILLCFDNFEHVLEGRQFIADILKDAPQVKIVVTSREQLHLQGEQVYQLDPLPVGSGLDLQVADALVLFADRAALVDQAFQLTPGNTPQVEEVCRTLSGIPLAIELAAAWMDSFTLTEMIRELEQQLELEARYEDVPGRHKSLRASMDWSWNLLADNQRETLMRMATFKGGAFAAAAEAVLGLKGMKLRKALAMLMDKSWLSTREELAAPSTGWVSKQQVQDQTRWYLRDAATREYAFEKLEDTSSEVDSIYQSAVMTHAGYFSGLVEREGPRLETCGQLAATAAFEVELENIVEAMDSLLQRISTPPLEPSPLNADPSSSLLPIVHWLGVYLDTKADFKEMLAQYLHIQQQLPSNANAALRGWTTIELSAAYRQLSQFDAALEQAGIAVKLAREHDLAAIEALALQRLGSVYLRRADFDRALSHFEQCLEIQRRIGDELGAVKTLLNMSSNYGARGDIDRAMELLLPCLEVLRRKGSQTQTAAALSNMGNVYYFRGDNDRALALYEESLENSRLVGDVDTAAEVLCQMGNAYYQQEEYERALELYGQSLEIQRRLGNEHGAAATLSNMGTVCSKCGEIDGALVHYVQALEIERRVEDVPSAAITLACLAGLYLAKGELNKALAALIEGQAGSEKFDDKVNQAHLHCIWARYWLLVFAAERPDTISAPQVALEKALQHLAIVRGLSIEQNVNNEFEFSDELITTARRAIIEFAGEHSLIDGVADLIAEQQTEDSCATD
jgi:predicted ATPase/class 3 adenylate cyclase